MTFLEQEMQEALNQYEHEGMTPELRERFQRLSSEWLVTDTEMEIAERMKALLEQT